MESLLHQSRAMCPFLNRTAPSALRSLATATRPSTSPGGGTISNLQVIARRCPVMSKALAVQSTRMTGVKRFASCAAGVAGLNGTTGHGAGKRQGRGLHTTARNKASLEAETYKKGAGQEHGEYTFWPGWLMMMIVV